MDVCKKEIERWREQCLFLPLWILFSSFCIAFAEFEHFIFGVKHSAYTRFVHGYLILFPTLYFRAVRWFVGVNGLRLLSQRTKMGKIPMESNMTGKKTTSKTNTNIDIAKTSKKSQAKQHNATSFHHLTIHIHIYGCIANVQFRHEIILIDNILCYFCLRSPNIPTNDNQKYTQK